MKKKPTFIDLFAGAGGLSHGFKQAGFRHVLGVEKDPKMAETYERNIGKVLVKDIREVKGTELPKVDLIIGGPPCQGFSSANKNVWNERKSDERQKLIFEFARVVNEVKPKMYLMENVATLSSNRFKESHLDKFTNMLKNYDSKCEVIELGTVANLPQKRKRLICVGKRKV